MSRSITEEESAHLSFGRCGVGRLILIDAAAFGDDRLQRSSRSLSNVAG